MPEAGPRLWVVRHGETEWSASGRHTSRTDLPLTASGEKEALALSHLLAGKNFALVEASPMKRARQTAELAGFEPLEDPDLSEWDYGELEGLTTEQVRERWPGWTIWEGPWPGGERPEQVGARAARAVSRVLCLPEGSHALFFSHGHILRVIAATWLRRPPTDGCMFVLGTGTVSVLGWEHGQPAVEHWAAPPGGQL